MNIEDIKALEALCMSDTAFKKKQVKEQAKLRKEEVKKEFQEYLNGSIERYKEGNWV